MSRRDRLTAVARGVAQEARLFLGYALIVFRPGAWPPQHPSPPEDVPDVPGGWSSDDYRLYIDEARRDMDRQGADKSDVRARAQWLFTAAIVLIGTLVAAYTKRSPHNLAGLILYPVSGVLIILACLAAGGVITAQSPIGAPKLSNLLYMESGEVDRRLAVEYAASRDVGARTVAVLVTVLRDCVFVVVLGLIGFGAAYLWGASNVSPANSGHGHPTVHRSVPAEMRLLQPKGGSTGRGVNRSSSPHPGSMSRTPGTPLVALSGS